MGTPGSSLTQGGHHPHSTLFSCWSFCEGRCSPSHVETAPQSLGRKAGRACAPGEGLGVGVGLQGEGEDGAPLLS